MIVVDKWVTVAGAWRASEEPGGQAPCWGHHEGVNRDCSELHPVAPGWAGSRGKSMSSPPNPVSPREETRNPVHDQGVLMTPEGLPYFSRTDHAGRLKRKVPPEHFSTMRSSMLLRMNLLERGGGRLEVGAGEAEALYGANSGRKSFPMHRRAGNFSQEAGKPLVLKGKAAQSCPASLQGVFVML